MKVVIVGFGSIARKHVEALRALRPAANIFALRSSTEAQREPGMTNLFQISEVLELRPDFVILSNPTIFRGALIAQLIPLGVPLFIEKPVLANLALAPELKNRIKQQGLLTYVACNLRFLGCLNYLKENLHLEDRRPNEVNVYCGSYLPEWRPYENWREGYSARAELGGGVHLDLIHELDYLYWIFGKPEKIRATRRSTSSLEITAVDFAHFLMEYPSFVAGVTLNYFRKDYKRTLEVVFPETTWTVDLARNSVTDHNGHILYSGSDDIRRSYSSQMRYFLQFLQGKAEPINTFDDGVEVLKIALNND